MNFAPRHFAPILLTAAALLAGCGQKGPLYLPDRPAPPQPVATPAVPANAGAQSAPATR